MKLSTPSIFLAAVILSKSAAAKDDKKKLGRTLVDRRRPGSRRRHYASANDSAKRGGERSLSRILEGFSMDNSMSLGMSRGGSTGGSSKSMKEPPLYDVESEVEFEIGDLLGSFGQDDYGLKLSFKHDENLPVPNDPDQCNPFAPGGPALAPDDKPYLATREFNIPLSDEIYQATGFASIGLDYQACGHPPMNVFTKPHYDVHFYTDSKEVRDEWTCDQPMGAPICDSNDEQTTASGRAFFNVQYVTSNDVISQPSNMPGRTEGIDFVSPWVPGGSFKCDVEAAIPGQGIHCWDQLNQPVSVADWNTPVLIMGSYNGKIAFFEPMIPLEYISDGGARRYKEIVHYAGQTIDSLPGSWDVRYNENDDGRAVVTLFGIPNIL